jgi:hypothetical protein
MDSDPDAVGAGQWVVRDSEKMRWTPRLDKRPGAQDRASFGVKRERTKEGAPFSAALQDTGTVT